MDVVGGLEAGVCNSLDCAEVKGVGGDVDRDEAAVDGREEEGSGGGGGILDILSPLLLL
jgi:hypothetical protein